MERKGCPHDKSIDELFLQYKYVKIKKKKSSPSF